VTSQPLLTARLDGLVLSGAAICFLPGYPPDPAECRRLSHEIASAIAGMAATASSVAAHEVTVSPLTPRCSAPIDPHKSSQSF